MKIIYTETMNDNYGALLSVVEYPKNTNVSTQTNTSKKLCLTLSHTIQPGYFNTVIPTNPAIKSLRYETQSDEDNIDYIY